MGRTAKGAGSLEGQQPLFKSAELPEIIIERESRRFGLQHPLWTEKKAQLIQEYMRLFVFVTHHGTYIDGFAAPQRRNLTDLCSAELVLRTEPKWMRRFWLCDLDPAGVTKLEAIAAHHQLKGRKINVVPGDFNETVDFVLAQAGIQERTAAFALLDQRTFECSWSTVQKIANHKTGRKIEIFYFLASGWMPRAMAAAKRPEMLSTIERWWGNSDWGELRRMGGLHRAQIVANRFKEELGYAYVHPYAIHDRKKRGRTMYHMIHATDHPEATPLMIRAYRKISGRRDIDPREQQIDLETFWRESQEELPARELASPAT